LLLGENGRYIPALISKGKPSSTAESQQQQQSENLKKVASSSQPSFLYKMDPADKTQRRQMCIPGQFHHSSSFSIAATLR
jgi:hypothetical protein